MSSYVRTAQSESFWQQCIQVIQSEKLLVHAAFSLSILAIFGARLWVVGSMRFYFLLWNLFLAWVPLGISLILLVLPKDTPKIGRVGLVSLWILFLPNAPYILTDLMHLRRSAYLIWFDTLLISSFALQGWILGLVSIEHIRRVALRYWRPLSVKVALVMYLFLSSCALYIGRFLRWNSWDVFASPWSFTLDIVEHVFSPLFLKRGLVMILICFILLLFSYVLLFPEKQTATASEL